MLAQTVLTKVWGDGGRVTETLLRKALSPPETLVARAIVPVKLPMAVTMIVLLAQDPETMVKEDGLAVMEKSDRILGTVSVSVIVWDSAPDVPVIVSG